MKTVDNGTKTLTDEGLNSMFTLHCVDKYISSEANIDFQICKDAYKAYHLTRTAEYLMIDLVFKAGDVNKGGKVNVNYLDDKKEIASIKDLIPNITKKSYRNAIHALIDCGVLTENGWLTFNPLLKSNHVGVFFHTNGCNGTYINYIDVAKQPTFTNTVQDTNQRFINDKLGMVSK